MAVSSYRNNITRINAQIADLMKKQASENQKLVILPKEKIPQKIVLQ